MPGVKRYRGPVAYYNEFDPYAAQWLRNLISAGHIAYGHVDERDIKEVAASDLDGYTQHHFFAGIGGWSLALRMAGWPDDRPVWTGSCPCQPFSNAGKRKGTEDERHLWPVWREIIREYSEIYGPPAVIFGEQVTSKDGRAWLSRIRSDLEEMGNAVGAADMCAAGTLAPHVRQRLWWVAHTERYAAQPGRSSNQPREGFEEEGRRTHAQSGRCGVSSDRGSWYGFDVVPCADGKSRRIEPGTFPLAHGVPNRVAQIRAYGNAIVPELAAEFIGAYLDCER